VSSCVGVLSTAEIFKFLTAPFRFCSKLEQTREVVHQSTQKFSRIMDCVVAGVQVTAGELRSGDGSASSAVGERSVAERRVVDSAVADSSVGVGLGSEVPSFVAESEEQVLVRRERENQQSAESYQRDLMCKQADMQRELVAVAAQIQAYKLQAARLDEPNIHLNVINARTKPTQIYYLRVQKCQHNTSVGRHLRNSAPLTCGYEECGGVVGQLFFGPNDLMVCAKANEYAASNKCFIFPHHIVGDPIDFAKSLAKNTWFPACYQAKYDSDRRNWLVSLAYHEPESDEESTPVNNAGACSVPPMTSAAASAAALEAFPVNPSPLMPPSARYADNAYGALGIALNLAKLKYWEDKNAQSKINYCQLMMQVAEQTLKLSSSFVQHDVRCSCGNVAQRSPVHDAWHCAKAVGNSRVVHELTVHSGRAVQSLIAIAPGWFRLPDTSVVTGHVTECVHTALGIAKDHPYISLATSLGLTAAAAVLLWKNMPNASTDQAPQGAGETDADRIAKWKKVHYTFAGMKFEIDCKTDKIKLISVLLPLHEVKKQFGEQEAQPPHGKRKRRAKVEIYDYLDRLREEEDRDTEIVERKWAQAKNAFQVPISEFFANNSVANWADESEEIDPFHGADNTEGHRHTGRRAQRAQGFFSRLFGIEQVPPGDGCLHGPDCPKQLKTDGSKVCNCACKGQHCVHWAECKPPSEEQKSQGLISGLLFGPTAVGHGCIHAPDCPMKLLTDGSKNCNRECGGQHCVHFAGCMSPPVELQRPQGLAAAVGDGCIHYANCPLKLRCNPNIACNQKCGGRQCTHFASCAPPGVKPLVSEVEVIDAVLPQTSQASRAQVVAAAVATSDDSKYEADVEKPKRKRQRKPKSTTQVPTVRVSFQKPEGAASVKVPTCVHHCGFTSTATGCCEHNCCDPKCNHLPLCRFKPHNPVTQKSQGIETSCKTCKKGTARKSGYCSECTRKYQHEHGEQAKCHCDTCKYCHLGKRFDAKLCWKCAKEGHVPYDVPQRPQGYAVYPQFFVNDWYKHRQAVKSVAGVRLFDALVLKDKVFVLNHTDEAQVSINNHLIDLSKFPKHHYNDAVDANGHLITEFFIVPVAAVGLTAMKPPIQTDPVRGPAIIVGTTTDKGEDKLFTNDGHFQAKDTASFTTVSGNCGGMLISKPVNPADFYKFAGMHCSSNDAERGAITKHIPASFLYSF